MYAFYANMFFEIELSGPPEDREQGLEGDIREHGCLAKYDNFEKDIPPGSLSLIRAWVRCILPGMQFQKTSLSIPGGWRFHSSRAPQRWKLNYLTHQSQPL